MAEIDKEVKENPVVVYMKGTPRFPMCGFSAATVEVLNEIGVPFKAVDILAEADKRDGGQGLHQLAHDPAAVRRRKVRRRLRHRPRDARQGRAGAADPQGRRAGLSGSPPRG